MNEHEEIKQSEPKPWAGLCPGARPHLRSHDQFNTTIYGMDDRYRGISNARRIILVNPVDLRERGIPPCTQVDITSIWGEERRTARSFTAIPYEMPRGAAAAYFPRPTC